jgi:hypothetical protein
MNPDLARYADSVRLVLYHKQATSARTRYLRLGDGSICAFQPLPGEVELCFEDSQDEREVLPHPGAVIAAAEHWLGLDTGALEFHGEFRVRARLNGHSLSIFLLRFTDIDPPFHAADAVGAAFIAITEARGLPTSEMEVLRRSYEYIMEG